MPTTDQLVTAADAARFARDWVKAASLYQKARASLSPLSPKKRAAQLDGLAELSRGMLAQSEAGRLVEAVAHLEKATRLFHEAADMGGVHHAAAFAELARARRIEMESLEVARKHFIGANTHFRALLELRPEDSTWRGGVVVTDLGLKLNGVLAAIESEDVRSAPTRLAELRAAASSVGEAEAYLAPAVENARRMARMCDVLVLLLRERQLWRRGDFVAAAELAHQAARDTRTMPEAKEESFVVRLADLAEATALGFAAVLAGEVGKAYIHAARADSLSVLLGRALEVQDRKPVAALAHAQERRAAAAALHAVVEGRSHPLFVRIADEPIGLTGALGEQLRRDLQELERAFGARAWRLCLIATGSALEGLLLHALRSHDSTSDFSRLGLADLVDRAARAGLVSQGARLMSDALREHRNLIHPAAEERRKYRVDADAAVAGLSILKSVIDDMGSTEAQGGP